ncbi:hypothetical protein IscW_ISCW014968 [Ixodes scapularis]|uniref:Uncharacterized protein n=1 Tax=Ixodes scapularis TaxID=6945 RepID=B7QM60_IXOSC|nr:hypothetical protein IscW_ISCW014968 [Ixodes scapularis]|eukprot:XP_002416265.1 hypothetical protein IscW_ISCW014968 [Ixodes scapularis]
MEVTRVNCVIRLYTNGDEKPSGGVTLQADAGRTTQGPLHLTLGAPCAFNRQARCVTEDSDCDRTRNPAVCACREGFRFIPEVLILFVRDCSDGYYIVDGHCVPGQTSKWPSVRASSMAKLVLSLWYSIAVIALGIWLYHHSHSPSLVYERSVTTWEFLPKMEH